MLLRLVANFILLNRDLICFCGDSIQVPAYIIILIFFSLKLLVLTLAKFLQKLKIILILKRYCFQSLLSLKYQRHLNHFDS